MVLLRFYLVEKFEYGKKDNIISSLKKIDSISDVQIEKCFHIEFEHGFVPNSRTEQILRWLLKDTQNEDNLKKESSLPPTNECSKLLEIGPRFNFQTPFSTNCVNICRNVGIPQVRRLEVSIRYYITYTSRLNSIEKVLNILCDKMTHCQYTKEILPISSFDERLPTNSEPWSIVPLLTEGCEALKKVNQKLGLSFSDWDIEFYSNLFQNQVKRNPTTVELFDCAQSNSEHSRHWFFKGKMIIDSIPQAKSLFQMITDTQKTSNQNNTVKFSDNSSAIKGFSYKTIQMSNYSGPGKMILKQIDSDLIFTAETHNMPTAVEPFSGATTGPGGRIRDVQSIGRGGLPIAGTAGYCVGNLKIPEYIQSYENTEWNYPPTFASPLKIIIEASNGASDYGNKFGEPLISGFAISYGQEISKNERVEYIKPIMFSGGVGTMQSMFREKIDPSKGMLLAKIGGPVYRIGVGGGAASSVEVQGDNNSELDFNAVQRGDAEMENKLNRVIRTCIEMGDRNPIIAIHDQGAGGNGNVLKELVEPRNAGAVIFTKEFNLGDPTITTLELWGAEYQENNAILCKPEDQKILKDICERERCPISFVGFVTGNGYVTLLETEMNFVKYMNRTDSHKWGNLPFDMHLEHVLGNMPQREYHLDSVPMKFSQLELPNYFDVNSILENVLSLLSVGSKRFLTNKVDRCVTGLVAQQQCVGPLHTPLCDYAITAVSHFSFHGIATSIGTQPIKGLLCPRAGARMSVAESLSNLVFVGISELGDVKCSGNWMWAAKLPGEGLKLYEACQEMCQIMSELNIAVDGGKDSLSMAARVGSKTVKSPGTLVISTYAPCPDIRVKVTPDLKLPARNKNGELIWINIENRSRLGGSALAQCLSQTGDVCPNLLKTQELKNAFNITQKLLKCNKIMAGHDISDGGLIVCLLEMAFAGLCGLKINLTSAMKILKEINIDLKQNADFPELALLFAEECGWIIEVESMHLYEILKGFQDVGVSAYHIGQSSGYGLTSSIEVLINHKLIISNSTRELFKLWERTSFELEKLQMNKECAIEEYKSLEFRTGPTYKCNLNLDYEKIILHTSKPIKVGVLREEGINSDREMIATLLNANFEVYDISMHDLLNGKTNLDQYRGIIFPGGFSYADTLGSAKGWAANIMFNEMINLQFNYFKERSDTFSLGVCNGCQLMSLIGWIGDEKNDKIINVPKIALLKNKSDRFECRWSTLKIVDNISIMLKKLTGSIVGCWVAHGEGRFTFKDSLVLETLKNKKCIPIYYVDDMGEATEQYPMNPNGSIDGIAGICSTNGRHLALMPHPERSSIMWQWPYKSPNFELTKSPWQSMFDEAYIWCLQAESNS